MNNYPNMSYCAIENTSRALDQVFELLQEHIDEGGSIASYLENASRAEQRSWTRLLETAQELVEFAAVESEYED